MRITDFKAIAKGALVGLLAGALIRICVDFLASR